MKRLKALSGICLCFQAITFFVMLIMVPSNNKKRALALGVLAAGCGIAGAYLLLKESKNYEPSCCCCCDEDYDESYEFEEFPDDIDFSFADEELVAD